MKQVAKEELLAAIREIAAGEIYVSRKIAMLAFQKSLETQRQIGHQCQCNLATIENLSDREIHVFQLIGSGLGTKEIAGALNLSVKTIETHRENIKHKLSLGRGAQLTERATRWVTENLEPLETSEMAVIKKKKLVAFRAA
jgi:DNA-binding NarL/FixJ family response regulator